MFFSEFLKFFKLYVCFYDTEASKRGDGSGRNFK